MGDDEEETPHWKNKNISSKLLSKFIGKNFDISFRKYFYIPAYNSCKSHINGIINRYDNRFVDVSITITNKVKKETITKKYSYLFDIESIVAIGMEVE